MFSHIFIDEAGQCTEAELWIPLGGLATQDTTVVLCGDPKQLGPVITLDISRGSRQSFKSPLVRFLQMNSYMEDK